MLNNKFFDQLSGLTVRLECDGPKGKSFGTGFCFAKMEPEENSRPFIVTNKHVLEGATSGKFFFLTSNLDGSNPGQRHDININNLNSWWIGHPNKDVDVAVFPFGHIILELRKRNKRLNVPLLDDKVLLSEEETLIQFDSIEDAVFIGYPSALYDEKNLLPISRKGITATPIYKNFNGQPVFLLDASVFPGSSGSPVFITKTLYKSDTTTQVMIVTDQRITFVGIISATYLDCNSPSQEKIDLGIVFKAHTIVETINEFLKVRG